MKRTVPAVQEQQLRRWIGEACGTSPVIAPVPEGLEERVLARVAEHAGESDTDRNGTPSACRGSLTGWLRPLALAAAAMLLIVVTAAVTKFVIEQQSGGTVEVHLVLEAPGASRVVVAGDWNGWDTAAQPLRDSDGDGVWELRLRVKAGQEYEYQFVIDDRQWISDPRALLRVDDGFGGTNSVLDI